MPKVRFRALAFVALASCGSKEPASPPVIAPVAPAPAPVPLEPEKPAPETTAVSPPEKRPIAVEETLTLASGATFRVPVGWTMDASNAFLVLESPEHDIRVAVGDVSGATSADEAVMKVWHAFDPQWSRPLRIAQERPPRKGWDQRKVFSYETSPNEKRVVTAIALRRAEQWTVVAMDGDQGGFEKRVGQIQLVGDSLRPAGYSRESFAGKTAHELDADAVAKIMNVVDQARLAAEVPGVGLALVQGGKVVYAGGLGVRSLGKRLPVNEHTLFMIASNTKALTTFMLAKLVDEGRFAWDTPVTQLYAKFALGTPEVTKQVLVKHLLCACTGLPRQDLEWLLEFDKQTPAGVMKLLSTMQPTSKFGEVFQYSNLMAAAAGYVGAAAVFPRSELGAAYDAVMQSRVFTPLGMRETTFDFTRALAANHATPHGNDVEGRVQNAALDLDYAIEAARPAGGAWSSVHDLAKYVMVELAKGKLPDGKQHISEANIAARQAPQIEIGEDLTYGMGLFVDVQYGTPVVRHGGDL
ncbi:MAG TPA: serine hydrolase domain-containing protein, partial [Myxococcota bacterium]|nr:serine hydrolase domain-containing protein [Myxococcota bacterium]